MSIYSGFAVRKMEQKYNILVSKLILLLQSDVLQSMSPISSTKPSHHSTNPPEIKLQKYKIVLDKLKQFQQHKYLQPKFSELCRPLQKLAQQCSQMTQVDANNEQKLLFKSLSSQNTKIQISKTLHERIKSYTSQKQQSSRLSKTSVQFRRLIDQKVTKYSQIKSSSPEKLEARKTSYKKPFSSFTIQEVQENDSHQESSQIKNQKPVLTLDNISPVVPAKKFRIYKSCQKRIENIDEPTFPTFGFDKDPHKAWSSQKMPSKSMKCEPKFIKIEQLDKDSYNLSDRDQKIIKAEAYSFEQSNNSIKIGFKTPQKRQNPVKVISQRYKKFIDQSSLRRKLTKYNRSEIILKN